MHTDRKTLKPLKIGELTVEKPIIQGGMGVGVSRRYWYYFDGSDRI